MIEDNLDDLDGICVRNDDDPGCFDPNASDEPNSGSKIQDDNMDGSKVVSSKSMQL